MKKLEVFFCGWGQRWPLGTLADNGSDLLFEYSPQALAKGIELSPPSLKLRAQAYANFPAYQHRLPGLISDALPDGWGMLLWTACLRSKGVTAAAFLRLTDSRLQVTRAKGALTFEPAADMELSSCNLALLDLAREVKAVMAGRESTALKELALLGGSPQGARPKVLLQYDTTHKLVSAAPTARGTAWLVKFQARKSTKRCA
jgi:serine/threonine-protein kinase HipA